MAKQDITVELFYNSAWNDHTTGVYARQDIQIVRGRSAESTNTPPSQATLTFDNRDGTFNPTNPNSPLYGLVGRNTPLRITVGTDVRFVGEIASWAPRRDEHGDAWTDVTAAGVSRRLSHGAEPLHSPIRREALDADDDAVRVAYWPMEDEAGAGRLASAVPGAPSAQMRGEVTPASYTGFGGSLPLPLLGDGGNIFGNVPRHTAGAEYARVLISVPSGGMTDQSSMLGLRCRGGDVARFEVTYGATFGDLELRALADDGTELDTSGTLGFDVDGTQFLLSLELVQNGADIDWLLFVRKVTTGGDVDVGTLTFSTFLGLTLGEVMRMGVGAGGGMDGAAVGHMMIGTDQSLVFNISEALTGWRGEAAGDRLTRLADELDVPWVAIGSLAGADDSQPMGPQPTSTLPELLAEIERTDGGFIYDTRAAASLTVRTGRSLYNQDPVLALTFGTDVWPPLDPVLDDQALFNDVTAARADGSSARAVLESGLLSVDTPPAGAGRNATTVDVNPMSDDYLPGHAQWHLLRGTVEGARYPQVSVDLTAAGATLTDDTDAADIGDLITIDDLDVDQVRLIVVGYTETIGSHRRRIVFNCVPAEPFRIADAEGEVNNRVGFSSLWRRSGTITSTQTGITLRNEEGPDVTYESDFDLEIGGERMTVTAIGAWSGTYPARSAVFTVTRSVNGVVKAHPVDSQVRLADRNYIGL